MLIYTLRNNELISYFAHLSNYRVLLLINDENEHQYAKEHTEYEYMCINKNVPKEIQLRELFYLADTKIPIVSVLNEDKLELIDLFINIFEKSCEIKELNQEMISSILLNKINCEQKQIYSIASVIEVNEKFLLGDGENQPFYIKEDLKHFKNVTYKCPCIVGFNTFKTFPNGLKNRCLFVITKSHINEKESYENEYVKFFKSVYEAIIYWIEYFEKDYPDLVSSRLYVIGGESIYKQLKHLIRVHYLTYITYKGNELDISKLCKEYPITRIELSYYRTEILEHNMKINEYILNNKICNDDNLLINIMKHTYR